MPPSAPAHDLDRATRWPRSSFRLAAVSWLSDYLRQAEEAKQRFADVMSRRGLHRPAVGRVVVREPIDLTFMSGKGDQLDVTALRQRIPVGERSRALLAMVAPILRSHLFGISQEALRDAAGGDHTIVRLRQLPRLRREGSGDRGMAFEYAVHHAIRQCDWSIVEPLWNVLTDEYAVDGEVIDSIYFAREKQNVIRLIDPDPHEVTEKTLIVPARDQDPVVLHDLIPSASYAKRNALPPSLSGLWKTDLLIGKCDQDVWVGATVKSNPSDLESAPGLGIGIVPCRQGRLEAPRFDLRLGMWVTPVPYDDAFMEMFSCCWRLVEAFLAADAKVPSEENMPEPAYRDVAKLLAHLRDKPVIEVVEVVGEMSDLDLVEVEEVPTIAPEATRFAEAEPYMLLAPVPLSAQR